MGNKSLFYRTLPVLFFSLAFFPRIARSLLFVTPHVHLILLFNLFTECRVHVYLSNRGWSRFREHNTWHFSKLTADLDDQKGWQHCPHLLTQNRLKYITRTFYLNLNLSYWHTSYYTLLKNAKAWEDAENITLFLIGIYSVKDVNINLSFRSGFH